MRPLLLGIAALTAVGGTAVVVNQSLPPPAPEAPPAIDLPPGVAPFVDKKIVPYEIEGATGDALMKAIAAHGPRKGLARFWAYTEWKVDWQYRFKEQAGACAIDLETLAVRASIVQYLPHWKAWAEAAEPLKGDFAKFRTALNAHEDQHARHGIDAAGEILTALRQLPAAPACPEVEAAADTVGAALIARNMARDVAFDERTHNGMDGMPGL